MKQREVNRGEGVGSRIAIEWMYLRVQDLQVFLCYRFSASDAPQEYSTYPEIKEWRHLG